MRSEYGLAVYLARVQKRRDAGRLRSSTASAGFTLLELMVATAIFAILSAIAVPNVISWRNNAQFNAAVREVKSSIESARMAAIKSNLDATVNFDGSGTFTTQTQGIIGGSPTTKTVNHQLPPGVTVDDNGGGSLIFNSRGMTTSIMTITITRDDLSRNITVAITGNSQII